MKKEGVGIFEVVACLTLSEDNSSWHTINHPGTSLDYSSLRLSQICFSLIDRLTEFVVLISTKITLSGLNELLIRSKVTAEENTHSFTTENRLAYPFSGGVFGGKCTCSYLLLWFIIESW